MLHERSPYAITLAEVNGDGARTYDILHEMPFSPELKRMGVLLRDRDDGRIVFYVKGADSVMDERIRRSDWMEEEVAPHALT